ncbi:hypothetical protein [Streptomyces sp. NPDC006335]|uniref:hypothetical protein n=1 Tax=Streptomyces sp. NPDC006335 TaxID=3156895 RepID=UPI0033A57FE1
MTVHIHGEPVSGATGATGHTALAPQRQTYTVRVLALLLAVMTGTAAALAAFIVGDLVTNDLAEAIGWSAGTFVAALGLMVILEEKAGLFG